MPVVILVNKCIKKYTKEDRSCSYTCDSKEKNKTRNETKNKLIRLSYIKEKKNSDKDYVSCSVSHMFKKLCRTIIIIFLKFGVIQAAMCFSQTFIVQYLSSRSILLAIVV